MASKGVVPGEAVPALAWIWLYSTVDLGMSLQVVLSNKALFAMRTLELSVAKMGLYMRLDVLLSSKTLLTVWVQAKPFAVCWVRPLDEGSDIIYGDSCVGDGFLNIDA